MKKQIRKVLAYLAVVSMVFTLVAPSYAAEAKEKNAPQKFIYRNSTRISDLEKNFQWITTEIK